MAVRNSLLASSCVLCMAGASLAQIVSFNTPIPWVSQRSDTIVVRAQIDTAQVKQKQIALSLVQVSEGKQKKIASKTFQITDYSGEFSFGKINKDLVGGFDYLKVDWSIPGTQEKGTLAPIGIAVLEKLPKQESLPATHVKEGADAATIASLVKEDRFVKLGPTSVSMAWNKDAFFLIAKKSQDAGSAQIVFDGKSGKNAFLSYPDRIVAYAPATDSVWGTHFARELVSDSLKYVEKVWKHEITKMDAGDKIVVRVPWFDTGIIPFEERTIGLGMFAMGADGKVSGALPQTAKFHIPATWGDVILEK